VTQPLWRIAADAPDYTADDLSGEGARITGGRWNRKGVPALYATESRALACLETFVHLKAYGLPLNRYLVRIDVPDDLWASAERHAADALPIGWDAKPHGKVSLDFGTAWLAGARSCLLLVPSAIVPEEWNVVVNPKHKDHARLTATKERLWLYDPRLAR
jgi:RES domain-containing protein